MHDHLGGTSGPLSPAPEEISAQSGDFRREPLLSALNVVSRSMATVTNAIIAIILRITGHA
jgi:hypothetical protein